MSIAESAELVVAENEPTPKAAHGRRPQHTLTDVVSILARLKPTDGSEAPSIRMVARETNTPESTLRSWQERLALITGLEPETIVFFSSPAGVRFLHRLMVALFLVFGLMGGCGPSLLRLFLQMIGLDALVACSETTLRTRMRKVLAAVSVWGEQVQKELAATMPRRQLSVGVDETFFAKMVLVAMDMISGFILVEKTSEQRDAQTWHQEIQASLVGLNVELLQLIGDGATALCKLAQDLLCIPKIEDLWHGQNTISRGTAGPLAAKVEQATHLLATAQETAEVIAKGRAAAEERSPGVALLPEWMAREASAAQAVQSAEVALNEAHTNQTAMQDAVCALGTTLHPVNLTTGALQDAEQVEKGLQIIFIQMLQVVLNACLGERSLAAIRKAARLIPSWVAMVIRWHELVEIRLKALEQPIEVVALVRNVLIPGLYLSRVIRQTRDTARRKELQAVRERLLKALAEPEGVWRRLSVDLRRTLLAMAQDCVNIFQRSSGCVEGRNGYLSLHQHQMRGLGPVLLHSLTVIHNFVILRADGTTAAGRFFGRTPDQALFTYLCQVLPHPVHPRKRSRRPEKDPFFLTSTT